MNNNMFKKMTQKSLPSIMAITVTMFGLTLSGGASASTVTVDGIRMAGEYTATAPPPGTNSGTASLLWWNGHHSIYDQAAGNTNDLYWEINDTGGGLFSLNIFVEVPTYARRMLWAAGCNYDGSSSDTDCDPLAPLGDYSYLDAYLVGAKDTATPPFHHDSVKMDYETQTGSEFFQLNDVNDDSIFFTKWQDEAGTSDNPTWETSREYLIDQGICTVNECLEFNRTSSLEVMWLELSQADAEALLASIDNMELHLSDEARGLPEVPVPASVWLFGSGLLGLVGIARRKKA